MRRIIVVTCCLGACYSAVARQGSEHPVCYENWNPGYCSFGCSPPSSCCDIVVVTSGICWSTRIAEDCGYRDKYGYSALCKADVYKPDENGNGVFWATVDYANTPCSKTGTNTEGCPPC